ncbi:glycosyltransferase family 87 protein [Caulobacter sp. KR2-114]|uniref:glycosyltransferase family 87 protein n=1 Tax=Caulobacter sp. KR2-114 TaxID=3400912 RepID=UPI003C126C5A
MEPVPRSDAFAALRRGDWLTAERLRNYALILVAAYALAIAAMIATAHGGVDYKGRPLGADFSDVWTAGRLALGGHAVSAYDPAAHYAAQQAAFHRADIPYYGWHYPPFFLLLAAGLASLPYLAALALWQGVTLPLYLATIRAILPRREALLIAAAFPAVFINLTHGHNGFLTVALLGGGLACLRQRPLLAGVLFGLVAYKPQFGLFLPLALALGGHWKAFASAGATVLALVGVTAGLFGVEIWQAFLANTGFTKAVVLEAGGTGFWKIQSVFAAVRLWGGSVALAYAAQGLATAAAGVLLAALWRSSADFRLKAAGLMTACLLATPYCLDYDLMLLAPAAAFLVAVALEKGWRPFEASALAFVFAAPILTRPFAEYALIPLGLIATATLYGLILTRAFPRVAVRPLEAAPAAG